MVSNSEKHIVAVTALVRHPTEKKILVAKRHHDETAFPGKWAFPGGKLKRGETIKDGIKREVKEEVGLDIDVLGYLHDFTFVRPDNHNVIGLCFDTAATNQNVELCKDFTEHKWIKPHELKKLDTIPELHRAIKEQAGQDL